MSTQVDNYVASMEFDNSKFEKNVATSMSTLEKLKQKLNLDGASKGLEEINAAAGKVNMSGLGSGVDAIKAKFSALDVVAVTALANITNKAVDAGEKLVKSLSIDQLTAGWQKFSNMTTSSATLVAQGNDIADVNTQLDRLLYYTDETSYNFTEMVANIAKFTATGKGLEESVTAMEGIANWAALSGQNAATASRAMYQLSQAMGAGVMRLEDYKSIQNASMDTEEFRQKCIDAAVSLKTLKDNGDGTYTSLVKGATKTKFSISQFTTNLTDGMWLTSDVMMEVFNTYSSAVDAILDRADETGSLVSEVIDEIHDKADELKTDAMSDTEAIDAAIRELGYTLDDGSLMFDSFGLKALEAAQKARTFSDAIDSVKDAVSSQWMKTFQLLFGDANQATELWTNVANQLWDIFAGGGESRNSILETTMVSGWDRLVERINDAGIETSDYEQALRECAEAGGEDVDGLIKKYGSLSDVFKNGALSTDYLKKALSQLSVVGKEAIDFSDILSGKYGETAIAYGSDAVESVKKIQTALLDLGYTMEDYGADGKFGPKTWQAVAKFQKEMGLSVTGMVDQKTLDALEEAHKSIETIGTASSKAAGEVDDLSVDIDDLVDSVARPSGQELLFDTISNSLSAVSKVVETFREAWSEIFTDERTTNGLYNALSTIQKASERLVNFLDTKADKLKSTFKGVIAILDILTSIVGGALKAAFEILGEIFGSTNTSILDITGSVGDAIVWFRNWLDENRLITKGFNKLVSAAKKVIAIIKRWIDAFKEIPFVSDLLDDIQQLFADISSDVNDGTDNVEKWVGAFDGLSIVSKILDKVGEAVEWVGEVVEAGTNIFGAWFEVFKETEGVQHLIEGVTDLIDAFSKLFSGELDASEFASALGKALGEITASIPEMAIQIGKDFIAGFSNGLSEGIGEVISDILEFCGNFISAFMEGLGEHSPSVIAEEAGVNWVQGFINGIESMLEPLMTAIQPIIDFVTGVFKSFWGYITDENGEIQWDKIFAGAITIEALAIALKFAEAFQTLANAMSSFSGIFSAVKGVFSQLKTTIAEVGKAAKWDLTASAVMKMAIAVGILAAAIFLLAKIDDVGKLWNAVGVIIVLAGVVAGLAFVMSKLGDASIQFSAAEKKLDINGMKTTILQLGIALLLLAAAVKIIGSMEADEAKQGLISLAAMVGGMIVFMAAMGAISLYAKDLSKFSGMMTKMAVAMLLLVVVIKMVGKLDSLTIEKGLAFMGAFAIFTAALGLVTALCGEHVSKFGSMLIKLAIAMGLMVIVCKLVNKLSTEEALKGAAFAAAFVIFIKALVAVTTIGSEQKLAEVGGVIFAAGVAMLLMAAACKIVSGLTCGEIAKGLTCVVAFGLVLAGLIALLKIGNEQQMGKVAGSLIGASVAILIMAGTAVILSMIPIEDLAKGVAVVALFGVIMAGMIYALKGANDAQKSIKAMAVCIALMAAAVVALSFLEPADLTRCTAAMVILMGMLTLIIVSLKSVKDVKVGPLIALSGILLILAGIIYILQDMDPLSAISSAVSLATLMLTMVAAVKILNGMNAAQNLGKNVLALTAMAIPLLAFSIVLRQMNGIENAMSNAVALTLLMTVMTALLAAVSLVSQYLSSGIITGIASLTAMAIPMYAFILVLKQMDGIEDATGKIESLASMMTTMTLLLAVLAIVGLGGPAAIIGIGSLVALFAAIGLLAVGIGALMEKFPSIQKFLDTGLPVLEQLAGSIGTMIGKFIGGIGEGLSDSLVKMGEDIADFMDQLATASDNASGIKGESFDGVKQLMAIMLEIGGASIGTGITDGISRLFNFGDDSMETFEKNGVAFFNAMKAIGEASSGVSIDEESMNSVIGVAQKLADLQSSLEPIGGVVTWFTGRDDLGTFGTNIGQFVSSMITAFGSLCDANLDTEAMGSIIDAATDLATLQSSLEPIGGVISWFTGRDDLAKFGKNIGQFISSMIAAFGSLEGSEFNSEAMSSIVSAATDLATLQSSLEPIGGVISWFTGRDDLGTFGKNVSAFVESMTTAFESLDGTEFDTEAMNSVVSAATDLASLQASLEPIGGVISWFTGRDDLGTFGVNVGNFISSMKTALATLDGATLNEEALTSVITAASKLADLQTKLEPMGGVVSWFSGRTDLGTFGTNIGLFADAMGKLKTGMGENGISEEVMASVSNAGNAIIELQKALPEEGWFDGKMNLSEFSDYVTDFATAMSTFSTKATEIDSGAVNTCMNTATRIKSLIESLVDLDTSGVDAFTGIGSGGFGADGPAYDIACAIAKFGDKVADINTEAVSVAVTAAKQLKTLIAGLVGLDTSGIENFKPEAIGTQIKTYAEKVAGIDTGVVASSITSANRLKSFISGLAGFDTSGTGKFKPAPIGAALNTYSSSVSSINAGAIASSIGAAKNLKTFIADLAGLDTSGVSSFKAAIDELSTVSLSGIVEAFSDASATMTTIGVDLISGLTSGMTAGGPEAVSAANAIATSVTQSLSSMVSTFTAAGQTLGSKLSSGISSKNGSAKSAGSTLGSNTVSGASGKYSSMYSAGQYLGAGLVAGINSKKTAVYNAAYALGKAAVDGEKAGQKSNSPSKATIKAGKWLGEGLIIGIERMGSSVYNASEGMGQSAVNATRSAMTTVLDALNADMDAQPTIRPVVDLSDVQTGAAAVSGMFNRVQTIGVRSNLNAINATMNARVQNGTNDDIISAINKLNAGLENTRGDVYNFGDFTYDDGAGISDAVQTLVRAARMGRRV